MDFNLENIKDMIKAVDESNLTEFSLRSGDLKISMSKREDRPCSPPQAPIVMMGGAGVPMPAAPAPAAAEVKKEAESAEAEEDFISSPIVGTFYAAPAPDVEAFVKVGDLVKEGQTVCILEAMKLMNEIQAEYDCVIEQIMVSNEQKVEYGQPLFRVTRM